MDYVQKSKFMQKLMIPFYNTDEGVLMYEKTKDTLEKLLPEYLEEISGLAEGSGLPFKTVMLLNINCPSGSKGIKGKQNNYNQQNSQ